MDFTPYKPKFAESKKFPGLWHESHFTFQCLWWLPPIYTQMCLSQSLCIHSSALGSQETVKMWNPWRSVTKKLQILQFGHSLLKKTCKVWPERKNKREKTTASYIPKFSDTNRYLQEATSMNCCFKNSSWWTCFWRVSGLDQCQMSSMCGWVVNKENVITLKAWTPSKKDDKYLKKVSNWKSQKRGLRDGNILKEKEKVHLQRVQLFVVQNSLQKDSFLKRE